MVLFNGRPGYRFGSFGHYLVVNPSHRPHCLILDVRGQAPQQVTMIETAFFGHTAVFGTTQQHLYRIAGGWILRGSVRGGSFMEDPIATAHQKQTQFWASPVSEAIAGFHRLFAEHHFFRHQNGTNFDLPVPVLLPGESIAETAVAFSPDTTAVILKIGHKGRYGTDIHSFDRRGQLIRSRREKEDAFETAVAHYPLYNTTNALDDGAHYHWHPNGVIIQQSNALFFTADLK
jgi:hypothetical protein